MEKKDSQIRIWYKFALQQMAAESYSEQKDRTDIKEILKAGNNNLDYVKKEKKEGWGQVLYSNIS